MHMRRTQIAVAAFLAASALVFTGCQSSGKGDKDAAVQSPPSPTETAESFDGGSPTYSDRLAETFFGDEEMAGYAQANPVPIELVDFSSGELSEFTEVFPEGVSEPELVHLFPSAAGATVEEADGSDGGLRIFSPSENPATARSLSQTEDEADEGIHLVFASGDIVVAKALRWQCAWTAEYVDAVEADDAALAEAAATELRKFPTLDVIVTYNPELAASHESLVEPVLEGDMEAGKRFVERCSG